MIYDEDEYWNPIPIGSKNKYAPRGKHIMNKDEAKLCRKLMSETGLTEEELRAHKTYRVQLSTAQKAGQVNDFNRITRYKRKLMKEVTKELKLAKEHPDCLALYTKKMEERLNSPWGRPYGLYRISTKWDLK